MFLKQAGGMPAPIGAVDALTLPRSSQIIEAKVELLPSSSQVVAAAPRTPQDLSGDITRWQDLQPSLAKYLRPQAAYRWLLPYLATITPTYVESVLRGALAGNHVQAWELFDLMCDTDPEICSCVQEYCEGVLSHKIVFEPWHEEDEEPSDSAIEKCKVVSAALRGMRPDAASDENSLVETLRDLLFARFHGQAVVEVDWHDTYGSGNFNLKKVPGLPGQFLFPRSTFWVHPVCYAWSMGGRLGLREALMDLRPQSTKFRPPSRQLDQDITSYVEPPAWNMITSQPRPDLVVDFPRNKFLIGVFKSKAGSALAASCLRPLAWWWVASNFCGDYLMNYAQLFGIPFRKASYKPGTPEPIKQEIRQMLQSCGSAGYMLLPDTAELEFINGGGGAGQSPQAFLFHFADSQKRKVILHQTMTGGQHDSMGKGGGKAFGDVESETKDQCIAYGARWAAQQVNLQLIPSILELNYSPDDADVEVPECKLVRAEVGGLADAQTMQIVSQMIHVPASHWRRLFGTPKPGKDEEVAGVDEGQQGMQAQQDQANVEADRKLSQKNADANRKQKGEIAKQQAAALAKQPKAAAPAAGGGGAGGAAKPGQPPAGADDNAQMDARHSGLSEEEEAAQALHEIVKPLLSRIDAISKVEDEATRKDMMRKLLKDCPALTEAMSHDDSLANVLAPAFVRKFAEGLAKHQE